ncbi:MAG: hypothetical protein MJ078_02430, partial [Clostridia bacterium]|nr:hypothetical protein [Clostridia bacterium]
ATGYTTTIFPYKGAGLNGLFGGRAAGLFGKGGKDFAVILILLLFVLVIKVLEDRFLRTKLGYMLVAVGENEQWVISMGKDAGKYKILGLSLAGGLTAVSGALYTQLFSSYDNNCGSGKAVLALASVMVGLSLFGKGKGEGRDTTAVILGAILYSLCLNYLVLIDKEGIYLKLLNAVLFALILIFNDKLSNIRRVLAHRKTEVSSYAGTDGN